nr:immunoglobulin light chain junction region [Macaca mulatta]MOV60941.1 immunoglobulin light chain junction region [Macaca mulatta]MOV61098.1 immunoglobulin light chain junction region [Macaca mulatta]MOV61137.1 immunoglobulin light chain junction region [Macaca mulatta]MOV61162.1 immunoglobulin light chain junction region [Macaca mulatta]
CVQAIAFPFTF